MVLEPLLTVLDNLEPWNSEELISLVKFGLLDMDIPSQELLLVEMDWISLEASAVLTKAKQ